jgi:HK97 family phage portal protein
MDLFGIKRREEKRLKALQGYINNVIARQPVFIGGVAVYPSNDTSKLIEDTWETNISFYSVIKRITQKFGHLPRYVINEDQKQKRRKALDENIIEGDLSKLILRPNNYEGQDAFFEKIALQYLLTGEAFVWKNRGGIENGKVIELLVLPSENVNVIPNKENLFAVGGYELQVGGQRIGIPKEDIVHWKTANPCLDVSGSHLRGFNPLQPQKRTVTQSNDITDASTAMFQNGGARGALYNETMNDLDEIQQSKLKKVIDNKFNSGAKVKSAIATIQGKWGYHNFGSSSVDMQLLEADEQTIKKICNANGLPFELFQSDTTFANKKEAWYFFITNTLMPMAASCDGELTRGLEKDFKELGKGFIHTDFNELPEMQAMMLEKAKTLSGMWELSGNERRMLSGFEARPEKEMDEILVPQNLVKIEDLGIMPNEPVNEDEL